MTLSSDSDLGVLLTGALAQVVDRWRLRYDPSLQINPPHITVAYPPFVPPQAWASIRSEMAACLSEFKPFNVVLSTTGVFDDKPLVLWLRPEDDGSLVRIHAALAQHFPQYMPPSPVEFIPHVTIGFFDAQESLDQAQRAVLQELHPMRFEVRELVMIAHDANGMWQIVDRLGLGG